MGAMELIGVEAASPLLAEVRTQYGAAFDAAVKLAKGDKVDRAVWVPFELVTPENVANYLKKN